MGRRYVVRGVRASPPAEQFRADHTMSAGEAADPRRTELERSLTDAVAAESAAEKEFRRIVDAARSVSTDDEHDPEGVGLAVERALIVAALERARARQEATRAALDRWANGTYGRCAVCGASIDPARLAVLPHVTSCYACASMGHGAT